MRHSYSFSASTHQKAQAFTRNPFKNAALMNFPSIELPKTTTFTKFYSKLTENLKYRQNSGIKEFWKFWIPEILEFSKLWNSGIVGMLDILEFRSLKKQHSHISSTSSPTSNPQNLKLSPKFNQKMQRPYTSSTSTPKIKGFHQIPFKRCNTRTPCQYRLLKISGFHQLSFKKCTTRVFSTSNCQSLDFSQKFYSKKITCRQNSGILTFWKIWHS